MAEPPDGDIRNPPQALDVEVAVLGAMMLAAGAAPVVMGILEPTDFYRPAHQKIYSAMYRLAERSAPIDIATVASELEKTGDLQKCGGPNALIDIAASVCTAASAPAHARIIKDNALLRQLIEHATDLAEVCRNHPGNIAETIGQARNRLDAIACRAEPGRQRNEGVTQMMDTIQPEAIDWMWKPWIPLGSVSILEGDPKVGKSTITLQLAAIVSRGWGFPDGDGKPGAPYGPANVILMNSEDPLATVLRPRLDHAGADCTRIFALTGVQWRNGAVDSERMVTLQDVDTIEQAIIKFDAKLVIIDPIQAYFGAGVDMHRANETRPVLAGLGAIAERQRCAVLLVRHLRKMGGSATAHGLGGVDIFGYARSILLAWRDPDDPNRRILAHTATNFAREAKSLLYTLDDGFRWCGVDDRTAEDLANQPQQRGERKPAADRTAEWLHSLLSDGQIPANEVYAKAAREGYGIGSVKAAKTMLGVESCKVAAIWVWKLPNAQ